MSRLEVTIAVLAAVLFLRGPLAAAPVERATGVTRVPHSAASPPAVHDLHLKPGNLFRGKLPPDTFPQLKENVRIRLYRDNRLIAETRTDRLRRFTLRYLPTGTGMLAVSAKGTTKVCLCRFWAPGTAPGQREQGQNQNPTARAQGVHAFPLMSFKEVATFATVVGGAVATPIIWYNIQQDHKAPVSGS